MSREPFDAVATPAPAPANFVTGNALPVTRGRPARHARNAERVAAYRKSHARLDFVTSERIADTVASLAEQFDCSKNEVMNSLIRFALTNRDWRKQGLWGMNKPEGEQP